MTTIADLVAASRNDENTLRRQATDNITHWENWLQPVSAAQPAGEDPTYNDDYQRICEEVNKLSGIDTGLICTLAENLLTSVSKDIRIITFYIWARLHQDGESGLAEGLELLAGMLGRFGGGLHPQRQRTRKAALEWLGRRRMLDSLSLYPEVDLSTSQRTTGALLLTEEAAAKLDESSRPEFGQLYQALETRMAQCGGAEAVVPQNSSASVRPTASLDLPSSKLTTISSGRELLEQAKQLANYLREQPGGWLASHHLMKSLRWDTLYELPPLDASRRTRLVPPKPDYRAHLKRLWLQQSWQELLDQTDSLFSQEVNHLWLDLQWYACQARQKMEANTVHADIIRQDLKGLLIRLPGLESLAFSDGTPFADEVTHNWITRDVLDDPSGWQAQPVTVASSEDDILTLESEVLAKADSDGVDAALGWLQARPGTTSSRDQWLIRLLMARVTEQYGKNDMALHLLGELDAGAQRITLQQWSPSLLFEVKARRLKLLRMKAARSESEKNRLQCEMDTLLSGLIILDPARASVLCG